MEMFLLLLAGVGVLVFVQRQNDSMQRLQRIRVRSNERRGT